MQTKKSIEAPSLDISTINTSKTISTVDIKEQIRKKYKTLIKWNPKNEKKSRKKASFAFEKSKEQTGTVELLASLMKYSEDLKKKED